VYAPHSLPRFELVLLRIRTLRIWRQHAGHLQVDPCNSCNSCNLRRQSCRRKTSELGKTSAGAPAARHSTTNPTNKRAAACFTSAQASLVYLGVRETQCFFHPFVRPMAEDHMRASKQTSANARGDMQSSATPPPRNQENLEVLSEKHKLKLMHKL
jgi:hypothetical protein